MFKKTKFVLKLISAATIVFLVTACAPAKVMPVTTNFNPTVLKFEFDNTQGNVSKNAVIHAIEKSIESNSSLNPSRKTSTIFVNNLDFRSVLYSNHCRGNECSVEIQARNGERYSSGDLFTEQTITIPVKITVNKNKIVAKVSLTGKASELTGRSPVFYPYSPYLDKTSIENLYDRLTSIKPVVRYLQSVDSQMDIDLSKEVIFANLNRSFALKSYSAESATYIISDDRQITPMKVYTSPTRNGTLVRYSFSQKFAANSDGTTNYDSKTLKKLETQVRTAASK